MRQRRNYQVLEPVELSATESAKAERMIAEAEEGLKDVRVNFRWTKDKVDLIKEAAEGMGIPYQTYLKQVLLRQALKDIQSVATVTLLGKQKQAKPEAAKNEAPVKAAKPQGKAKTHRRREVAEA